MVPVGAHTSRTTMHTTIENEESSATCGGALKGRTSLATCEDWREKLSLPTEGELGPIQPSAGREQLGGANKLLPGLLPNDGPPKGEDREDENVEDDKGPEL